jgi:hypothetical protein
VGGNALELLERAFAGNGASLDFVHAVQRILDPPSRLILIPMMLHSARCSAGLLDMKSRNLGHFIPAEPEWLVLYMGRSDTVEHKGVIHLVMHGVDERPHD